MQVLYCWPLPDDMAMPNAERGNIATGCKFGCIHHEPAEPGPNVFWGH